MNITFGTDGWRGIIDKEINDETVKCVAQAFCDYLYTKSKNNKVAIGYDGRKYSEKYAQLFANVCMANNVETFLSDKIIPTPVLSFFVKDNNLTSGVMITASHNPPDYNGIKFKANYGGPFFTEETLIVENYLYKNSPKIFTGKIESIDLLNRYLQHIERLIDFNAIKKSNIKILVDSMSGAGQYILENLLIKYGINCKTIFGKADKNFSGRLAEPIEKNLVPLKNELMKSEFSLGLATDGDADRLGVVLDNGEWLSAQETILLLADYIINHKKLEGNIVKTSSVTDKLKAYFESDKRKIYDVQVGFKYICEKMIEDKIAFGCEESGGFGYDINMPERDGVFSALIFCEMLAKSNFNKLSDYVQNKRKEFGEIFYSRIDLQYSKPDRLSKLPELYLSKNLIFTNFSLKDRYSFYSSRGIINGLKFVFAGKSRWLLIRSSETEPMFRIYAEGESQNEVNELLKIGNELINS